MENEEMSNIKDKLGEIINCLIIDTKKRKNSNITDMIYLKDNAKEDVIAILLPFIESEKQKSYEKGRKEELLDILFDCKLVDNDVYNHKLSEEEAYNKLRDLISKSIDKNL